MTRTMDPFDELASMFLTQPDQPGTGGGGTPTAPIELLVVGHLPVRAGLWLTPYADAVARRLGPTVLLRLDREQPIVQIMRGDETTQVSAGRKLKQAIGELAGSASAWIVYSGAATPSDLVAGRADRVTVLSSADDAAVVAAYQHAKNLANAAEAQQTAMPAIGLSVLGADEDAAQRVFDRVNRTTTAFLGVEIELIGVLPKMDAAVRSTSYVNFPGERSPAVGTVVEWITEARQRAVTPPQTAHTADGPVHDGGAREGASVSEQERELLHQGPSNADEQAQATSSTASSPDEAPYETAASHGPRESATGQEPTAAPGEAQRQQPAVEQPTEPDPPLVEYVAYEQPKRAQQQQRQHEQQQKQAAGHTGEAWLTRPLLMPAAVAPGG